MKKIFLLLIISVAIFSCNSSKQINAPTPLPTFERTITITKQVHDTVLVVKADTVRIAAKLVTDSVTGRISIKGTPKTSSTSTTRANNAKVDVDENNNLFVDCFCDTAAIRFNWMETSKVDSSKHTIYAPPQIIEKPFTKWQHVQLWAGRIFLLFLLFIIGLQLLKLYKKV